MLYAVARNYINVIISLSPDECALNASFSDEKKYYLLFFFNYYSMYNT